MRLIILIVLALLTASASAQNKLELTRPNGGAGWVVPTGKRSANLGQAIAIDSSGNIYVTGYFQGTKDFGSISITSSDSINNMFLTKYHPDGSVEWTKHASGGLAQSSNGTYGTGVAVDKFGSVFVVGTFGDKIDFDGNIVTSTSSGAWDIFVAKYNSDGTLEWAKSPGDTGTGEANAVAVDSLGNVYVTGVFADKKVFGGVTLSSKTSGAWDIFIAKYLPDGSVAWAKSAGGNGNDHSASITIDKKDNVYLTGNIKDGGDFSGVTVTTAGGWDAFVAKYHTDGNLEWVKLGGGSNHESGTGISVDVSGNIYVTGLSSGQSNFGGISLTCTGMFIASYQQDGNINWVKTPGGISNIWGYGITTDHLANIYLTGYFEGTKIFDTISITSVGNVDLFVTKYHSDGAVEWVKRAGGYGIDEGYAVACDLSNNVYLTGSIFRWEHASGSADFENFSLDSSGLFLWKIRKLGPFIYLPDDSGYARDHKNIPILLEKAQINPSVFSVASNFKARIAYDNTLLVPENGAVQKGSRFDTVFIQDRLPSSDTIGYVHFLVVLGKSTASPMNIVDFHLLDASGNEAPYAVETENGTFHLLYGCGDNSLQKFIVTGKTPSITTIAPNPTNGSLHIDIHTTETGRTRLAMMDLLGQQVATICDGPLKPGDHSFNLNCYDLPSGSYFLMMQTPTVRRLQRVDVAK